ncbi:FHAD1 protein, partial [Sagittarius serpentarius]|nr:FHAD1 protein [Sagittarius serpentarius]
REERLKAIQEENEMERQKLQEEIVEYKEQSKQHSLTIVALEGRLLEAKQQQKALEEENAALVGKMEGKDIRSGSKQRKRVRARKRSAIIFLRALREELAAAQSALLSREAVVAGLTKELAETRARMSDMRGELSEEQKVDLERNLSRLKHQEREVNLLREKLSQMSSLAEKKDRALKAAVEELSHRPASGANGVSPSSATGRRRPDPSGRFAALARGAVRGENGLGCLFQEPAWDLADLGAKCRGLRHEETIQRQKEGLAELRERVKVLEKGQSSGAAKKRSEPLVVLPKDLAEATARQAGLEKEPVPAPGTKRKAGEVPGPVPNGGSARAAGGAASSEATDATDLGEKMYLDIIGALGSLMKVKELSGMQPLKHLPQEEREKAGLQRRKGLELLYDQIKNLKSRLERKEEMLKDYEASVEQLRLNQASLRRCQEEMSKLEDEASREAEEKALLKEALERTRLQLNQEKRLLRAARLREV